MTEDDLIAKACGVPRERYACGCLRPFSMGFGYRDPRAKCIDCQRRADNTRALVVLGLVVLAVVVWPLAAFVLALMGWRP